MTSSNCSIRAFLPAIGILFILLSLTSCAGPNKPRVPESLANFQGVLGGRVVNIQQEGFALKVGQIYEHWNSKGTPDDAIGKTIFIQPSVTSGGDQSNRPDPIQMAWVRSLSINDWISVSVNVAGSGGPIRIVDLTPTQKRQAQSYMGPPR